MSYSIHRRTASTSVAAHNLDPPPLLLRLVRSRISLPSQVCVSPTLHRLCQHDPPLLTLIDPAPLRDSGLFQSELCRSFSLVSRHLPPPRGSQPVCHHPCDSSPAPVRLTSLRSLESAPPSTSLPAYYSLPRQPSHLRLPSNELCKPLSHGLPCRSPVPLPLVA